MLSKSSYDSTGHAYFIFGYLEYTSKTRQGFFFLLFLNQIQNLSEVPKNPIPAKIHVQQTLSIFTLETDDPLDNTS